MSKSRLLLGIIGAISAVLWLVALLGQTVPALAAGMVGSGTPASCTSFALEQAVSAGSGPIGFDCGAAPITIVITNSAGIAITGNRQYTIDGNNKISLSGGDANRVFVVDSGSALTLTNISIVHGSPPSGDGGAILNAGLFVADHVVFDHNTTANSWSGGAILSLGPMQIRDSVFSNNSAGNGGALYPRFSSAVTLITNTTFYSNAAHNTSNGWGGAILVWDGAPVSVSGGDFTVNTSFANGGAIYVFSGGAVSSLNISGTRFIENSGAIPPALGGAIYTSGTLTVTNALFDSNHAGNGGAIFTEGRTANILRSTFTRNWASFGGAIQTLQPLNINQSVFTANGMKPDGTVPALNGGGIANNGGYVEIENSTLNDNRASIGAGLFQLYGASTLLNDTLSGNAANRGGGIDQIYGTVYADDLTINRNSATDLGYAGGIEIYNDQTYFLLFNSIVSDNVNGNCNIVLSAGNYNLSTDYSCGFGTGYDNVVIHLGQLANNGGFAPTHLPFADSPAVDYGSTADCLATDERGVARPQGVHCDIGAVERVPGEAGPELWLPLIRR